MAAPPLGSPRIIVLILFITVTKAKIIIVYKSAAIIFAVFNDVLPFLVLKFKYDTLVVYSFEYIDASPNTRYNQ